MELQDDGTYKFIFYDATDRWGSNGQCMNRLNDSAVLGLQTAGCDTFNIVKQTNGVYITKTN